MTFCNLGSGHKVGAMGEGGGGYLKNFQKIWYTPKRSPKNFVPHHKSAPNKNKEMFRTPPLRPKKHKRKSYITMNYDMAESNHLNAFMLTLGQDGLNQKYNYRKRCHLSSSIDDELSQELVIPLIITHYPT